MKEEIVATVDVQPEIAENVSLVGAKVEEMTVRNDAEYSAAGALLKQVKSLQKTIKDYWEPLRVSAKKAYDDVLSKKKEMLDPVDSAEKILKRKMGDYLAEKERIAREIEEQKRREAEAEMQRKLAEAAEHETAGRADEAEFAMAEAEVFDQYAANISIQAEKPKMQGVSTVKSWKVEVVDSTKVPVLLGGVELRPVDTAAVLRLVKMMDGKIEIPGVKITEDVSLRVRA